MTAAANTRSRCAVDHSQSAAVSEETCYGTAVILPRLIELTPHNLCTDYEARRDGEHECPQ